MLLKKPIDHLAEDGGEELFKQPEVKFVQNC